MSGSAPAQASFDLTNVRKAVDRASHDFRSDTVTVPTEDVMRVCKCCFVVLCVCLWLDSIHYIANATSIQAMLESSTFGDDVFDEDPTVHALQNRIAELTGKEAALWTLSGTMGNQICMRTHLKQPPHSVLLDHRAHVYAWESGALPALSQASVTPVKPRNGIHLTLEDVKEHLIPEENCMYYHIHDTTPGIFSSFRRLSRAFL